MTTNRPDPALPPVPGPPSAPPPPGLSGDDLIQWEISRREMLELEADREWARKNPPPPPEVLALREALAQAAIGQTLLREDLDRARSDLVAEKSRNTMLARRITDLETRIAGMAVLLNAVRPPDPDFED